MTSLRAGDAPQTPLNGWQLLAPIPDRIGFGGMMAGVIGDRLVAAAGSQFRDKPLWLKGEKAYNDRIYTLPSLKGKWEESATRLPEPVASPASAASDRAIYFAGGLNAKDCLRSAYVMRGRADGFSFERLPDLPHGIGYAAGALVGERFYVVGGLESPNSKQPSREVWSFPIKRGGGDGSWQREPDLPGPGVFVAAAGSDNTSLYVFGGIGFDADGKAIPSKAASRLAPGAREWEKLPDLPEARVGISAPCPLIGQSFFLIGGYADVFPGAPREHPGFNDQTYFYAPATRKYEPGPILPRATVVDRDMPGDVGPAPMIGAPCVVWRDHVIVVGGEVRSSVRTTAVVAWPLR